MKLLLDQGLPRGAADLLRLAGVDTVHVGEIGEHAAEDHALLQLARTQNRIVVTLDADFHALLAAGGSPAPSVVRIRIEGLRAVELTSLVQTILAQCADDLRRGAAVVVQLGRIRIRNLPLRSP